MKPTKRMTPKQIRALIRKGIWNRPTSGLAMGYLQANLVILPKRYAFDFSTFNLPFACLTTGKRYKGRRRRFPLWKMVLPLISLVFVSVFSKD
jgi:uncharacterized protein YcsI (UPF0317 family)